MTLVKQKNKRWVALGVCICFVATLFPEAHAALPSIEMAGKAETPRILNIDIPTELASVDEWYQAPSKAKPKLIVHIQDAHANYEAQTKIRDVIKYLNTNYGFKTILVEGAASELDPNILKLFPDQERNLKLADELAKIGEVTGAEMFLVENSDAAKGVGIEKPELYRRNFDALQKVYSEDEFVSGFFEAYEKKMGQISSRSFGPRMIQALAEWRKFENGHRDFLPFVSNLAELSKKVLGIDLGVLYSQIEWPQLTRLLVLQRVEKEMEKTNDLRPTTNTEESARKAVFSVKQQAELEKQQIIDLLKAAKVSDGLIQALERFDEKTANLNRIGSSEVRQASAPRALMEALVEEGGKVGFNIRQYSAFAKYAGYLILRGEIVPGDLFEEIKKLFDLVLESLVKDAPSAAIEASDDLAARKRLLLLHRDEMLARKLLKLELSHDEWLAVLNRQDRFYPDDLNRRMLEQLGQNTRVKEVGGEEATQMKKLNEAFRAAFAFYSAAVNRDTYFFQRTREVLAQTDKAILITGGFHAEGMKYFFRKYDINYGTLTPRITQEFSNEQYRKVMMRVASFDPATHGSVNSTNSKSLEAKPNQNYLTAPLLTGNLSTAKQREILPGRPSVDSSDREGPADAVAEEAPASPAVATPQMRPEVKVINYAKEYLSIRNGRNSVLGVGVVFFGVIAAFLSAMFLPNLLILAIPVTLFGMIYVFKQYFKARYSISNDNKAGDYGAEIASGAPELRETVVLKEAETADAVKVAEGPIAFDSLGKALEEAKAGRNITDWFEAVFNIANIAANAQQVEFARSEIRNLRSEARGKLSEAQTTSLIMKVAQLAVKLNQFQQAQKLDARDEVVVTAKPSREAILASLSPEDREILERMTFDDLENQINDAKSLSAPQAVAVLITFGIISENDHDAAKNMVKLASLAVAKVADEQISEFADMLRNFFPDMASDSVGRHIQVLSEADWVIQQKSFEVLASLNPNLEIVVFLDLLDPLQVGEVPTSFKNLKVRKTNKVKAAVNTLVNKLPWDSDRKSLLVIPASYRAAFKLNAKVQMAVDAYDMSDVGKNLTALFGKARKAQRLARISDLPLAPEEQIFVGGENQVLEITDESIANVFAALQAKYQALLKVMQSA